MISKVVRLVYRFSLFLVSLEEIIVIIFFLGSPKTINRYIYVMLGEKELGERNDQLFRRSEQRRAVIGSKTNHWFDTDTSSGYAWFNFPTN